MPTNKQRREAARRHLERQLERREHQAVQRKKRNMFASIAGVVILLVAIGIVVAVANQGTKKSPSAAASPSVSASGSDTTSASPSAAPSTSYPPATGAAVSFDGVTVTGASDLNGVPAVASKGSAAPSALEYKDLVVGTGATATATSSVTVQYVGVLYDNGTKFDSSWDRGSPTTFSLSQVVPGFTQGIGGTKTIPPMKVGGRRIMILPAALGYGSTANGSIPANSTLVFVVDLKSISAGS